MKNILKLHEAIAVVLINSKEKTSTNEFIANEINKRTLYGRKDEKPVPSYQIMQRVLLSNGKYRHLFKFTKPNIVTLK